MQPRLAALLALLLPGGALTLRLDASLVARGLVDSRAQAKEAILAGDVSVDGVVVKKAAAAVTDGAELVLASAPRMYVSRGGDKLRAALDVFGIDPAGAAVLDVGASTGGFTDCVLERGARSVVALDNGHGQLHAKLEADERVVSLEGVNARYLTPGMLPRADFDLIVVDVSFISLRLVLPTIWPLLRAPPAGGGRGGGRGSAVDSPRLVALVKPQFEAGKEAVLAGKGIVRDGATRARALAEVVDFAQTSLDGCVAVGSIDSPIQGGDGNSEYLLALGGRGCERTGPFVDEPP